MSVDLTTKVLCLKASAHFLIISNLYFLLTIVITAATIYAYFYCPKDLFGLPIPDEHMSKIKDDLIMKALGGITIIPFLVLSFLSGFLSCFKNKNWFGLCCIISAILAFIFLIYDGFVLLYLKLRYVWPPHLLPEVQLPTSPEQPFTLSNEDQWVHFTKVLIIAITFSMFAVVSILLYCTLLLANLSFLYKSPEPIPRRPRRPMKRRELEEEDDETGGDENETDEKENKKNEDGKEKNKKTKDEKKKKETEGDDQGTGTGTQTGTGMD